MDRIDGYGEVQDCMSAIIHPASCSEQIAASQQQGLALQWQQTALRRLLGL
jgi:hypothetical protein